MYTVAYVTDSNNGRRIVPYNGEEVSIIYFMFMYVLLL